MLSSDMRKESGTCNVCSAPCSSCMHRIATVSESNVEHNCKREETSTSSFNCVKSRAFYVAKHAASEASNLLSASSSQNSYSDSVEGQSVQRPSVVHEVSESVDMPLKFSTSEKVGENRQFQRKSSRSVSKLHRSTMNEPYGECLGDSGSCFGGSGDGGNLVMAANLSQNMSVACASKGTSSDKTVKKLTQTKGSYGGVASQVESEKKSLLEKSKNLKVIVPPEVNEEPKESVGVVKLSCTGLLTVDRVVTENPVSVNADFKQNSQIRNNLSSQAIENGNNCFKMEVEFDGSDETERCNESSEQVETRNPILEYSNAPGFQIQVKSHPIADSDNGLIDVNVCDICGDAGREALLATCSRCTDGAEHTYCMKVKLDKVPEGWICEKCVIEEKTEENKNYNVASISDNSEWKKKMNLKPETSSRPKISAKLGVKTGSSKTCEYLKVKQNSFKLPKNIISGGTIPAVVKELSETSNGLMISPDRGKSPTFSRCKSFKGMEMVKSKSSCTISSPRVQPRIGFQPLSRTISTGSVSLKSHKELCTPKVLSKQTSFDLSKIKLKDKLLVDGQAQKLVKESTFNVATKEVRSIAKSASFKSVNSGNRRTLLVNKGLVLKSLRLEDRDTSVDKIQPLVSPRLEDQTDIKPVKETNKIGRQIDTFPGRSAASLSPLARGRPLKVEQTTFDGKVNNKTDLTSLSTSKTFNFAKGLRCEEGKVQNSSNTSIYKTNISESKRPKLNQTISVEESFKANKSINRTKIDAEKRIGKAATKSLNLSGFGCAGDKSKDSTASSPKKASKTCDKEIGFHEGNDACHTTKVCTTRRLTDAPEGTSRVGRLKDAVQAVIKKNKIDKNSRWLEQTEESTSHTTKFCATQRPADAPEGTSGDGRLKDAFQAVNKKNKMNKNSRLLEQTGECTMTSNGLTHTVALVNSSNPKCQKYRHNKEACTLQQEMTTPTSDSSKSAVEFAMKQEKHLVEASCFSRSANTDSTAAKPEKIIPDKLHVKIPAQLVPAQPLVSCNAAASVIPQHEFIWQGSFEISSEGKPPRLLDGIQAHLASFVSPKVLEVVRHIPTKIQLKEIPRVEVWPVQFLEASPTEESIALYFFAKDAHSYEISYVKLLDWVLRNDMALIGIINEVELLIFPSNNLPDNSQRWNMLHFLWGVFRAKKENSSWPHPDLHEESCSSRLSRNLLSSSTCGTSTVQKIDSDSNPDKVNIRIDEIPESRPIEEDSSDVVKLEKPNDVPHVREQRFSGPLPKCFDASNSEGLEESSCQEEMRLKDASVKPENALDEHTVESDNLVWPPKPNLKRSYSCLSATDSKASKVFTRSGSWHEKHACFSEEDDKKVTRIKFVGEERGVSIFRDHTTGRNPSAKVFHLFGSVVEQLPTDVCSENLPSKNPNFTQDLRLLDPIVLKSNIEDSLGNILSSEVDESPISDSPDLELSLGAPNRISKKSIPPLLVSVTDKSRHISSGALADEDNVTLSLASPGTESDNLREPTLKTEQLFPEGSSLFKTCRAPFKNFAYT